MNGLTLVGMCMFTTGQNGVWFVFQENIAMCIVYTPPVCQISTENEDGLQDLLPSMALDHCQSLPLSFVTPPTHPTTATKC